MLLCGHVLVYVLMSEKAISSHASHVGFLGVVLVFPTFSTWFTYWPHSRLSRYRYGSAALDRKFMEFHSLSRVSTWLCFSCAALVCTAVQYIFCWFQTKMSGQRLCLAELMHCSLEPALSVISRLYRLSVACFQGVNCDPICDQASSSQ